MRWTVHGERSLYDSEWMCLRLVDIEPTAGNRFEHHVVRFPCNAAGTVIHDPERGFLLLWRHRFITDSWGWEIPAGRVEPGESPEQAAAREALEETGWRPGPLRHLASYFPASGVSDQRFHLYLAAGAEPAGAPADPTEAERVEWLTPAAVRAEMAAGRLTDGLSLTGVLWALAHGVA